MTVEQFEQLLDALSSQSGSHEATLVFAGILAMAGIVFVLWWVLNLKLAPLEKLSSTLEGYVKELNEKIAELSNNLWKKDELENKIKLEVSEQLKEHQKNCPCCKLHTHNE